LFSYSEVAPLSLSTARVLVVPSAPTPVEVGPSDLSPVTDTTALEFPSVSLAPNPSLALLLCRPPSRSELQVVSKTLPSMGYPPAGLTSMTRVGELVTLAPSLAASSGSHTGVAVLCPSGSLDLSDESMTMFFDALRLVLCRLGDGSGVLLRGNSSSVMISLL
jgi:hypothetical protein